MKKKFLWISLLLAITLLLSSCTNIFKREGSSTEQPGTTADPSAMLGQWYCADGYTVI